MSTPSSAKSKRRKSIGATTPLQQPPASPSTPASTTSSRNGTSSLAVHYTVVEVASRDGNFSSTVWMPESSMQLASVTASQIVAVSVHNGQVDDDVGYGDMENLEKHWCNRLIGRTDAHVSEAGSYCVIAKAWPCRKLKDGVKLSRALAHSLGCQQLGLQLSIRPVIFPGIDSPKILNHNGTKPVQMRVHECQELVLKWFPVELDDAMSDNISSPISANSTPPQRNLISKVNEHSPSSMRSDLPKIGSAGSKASKNFVQEKTRYPSTVDLSSIFDDANTRALILLQRLVGRMLQGRYFLKGNFTEILACGRYHTFQVIDARRCEETRVHSGKNNMEDVSDNCGKEHSVPWNSDAEAFQIGNKTQIKFVLPSLNVENGSVPPQENEGRSKHSVDPSTCIEFSSLGGLSEQIATLKEILTYSLLQPERLTSLGLETPHGVLLYGPPGTGKTSLAVASANEAGVRMFPINGPEIISEYYGESEAALQAVFAAAKEAAPSVVFIDELDAIAPQRTDGSEALGRRVVATLLTLMDGGCQSLGRVIVVATTNRVEAIDPALRRPGRFDREIEIGVPTPSGRLEILQNLLSRIKHSLTEADVYALASATHGFVGADLTSLCNEAAMVALRNYVQKLSPLSNRTTITESICNVELEMKQLSLTSTGKLKSLTVSMANFEEAKTRVRPSAMREVMLEVPRVRWSDIGGLDEIKQQLKEAVVWPQKHMQAFTRIGTQPPRGVLLYGPPGCSKTLLARAVATEAGLNFIAVKGPELFSKWVGESEKAVRSLFQRARVAAPSVIFFDELDALVVTRNSSSDGVSVGDRVISQLLVEMDGLSARNGVTVIAATNRPDKVDNALLRPGRFDRLLYVGPPDEAARVRIFEIHMKKMPCASDVDKNILAKRTQGYTGADIAAICRESAMTALEANLNATEVSMQHFDSALNVVQRSVSQVSESTYLHFTRSVPFMK